jgi:hypothetical protein
MNPAASAGAYAGHNMVLHNGQTNPYSGSVSGLIPAPDTTAWYRTQYGCLRTDPTEIARRHTFPDAVIPRGVPQTAAPSSFVCMTDGCVASAADGAAVGCQNYVTAWPEEFVDPTEMVLTEARHPQFAFRPGGPGTPYQIDVESQLRRLDQPLTNCQAVMAEDAPLYRNTVAPPVPPMGTVSVGVQNATNPIAAIVTQEDRCRAAADVMASAMSGRWLNNPTRQDTKRFEKPFSPPGIGTGAARSATAPATGRPYYTN